MFDFVSRFEGDVCRCCCIIQSQSGPWCVATRCSPLRNHPTSRRSGSVLVELDLAEDVFCCQILRLLSLHIHFPLTSIFVDFFHFHPCIVVLYFIAFRLCSFLDLLIFQLLSTFFDIPLHLLHLRVLVHLVIPKAFFW